MNVYYSQWGKEDLLSWQGVEDLQSENNSSDEDNIEPLFLEQDEVEETVEFWEDWDWRDFV